MVTAFAVDMANIYGEKTTISRGRVHGYLLMELDLGMCPGTLIIYMIKYLQKIIDNFPEVLRGTKACPAGDNILIFKTINTRSSCLRKWRGNSTEPQLHFCFYEREQDQMSRH